VVRLELLGGPRRFARRRWSHQDDNRWRDDSNTHASKIGTFRHGHGVTNSNLQDFADLWRY